MRASDGSDGRGERATRIDSTASPTYRETSTGGPHRLSPVSRGLAEGSTTTPPRAPP